MAIDLRNPQGEFGGSFQAAADILTAIQRANKARADRSTLNQISKARALNPEATLDEIIAGLPQTQDADGLAGFIQRLTGAGQSDILPELQARSITQPRSTLSAAERAKAERIKAGLLPRAGTVAETKPFKKTPEEIQRDKDIAFLNKSGASAKGRKPFQVKEAQDRLKALPPGNLAKVEVGTIDKEFKQFIKKVEPEITRAKDVRFGFDDKVFGQDSFEFVRDAAVAEGLKDGIDPASMEEALVEWWNRQFEKEKGQKFQKFAKIETGEPTGVEQDPTQIIQQAAQEGLLTEEDVRSITAGLQADPSKLQDVLDLIERKRSGK